MVCKFFDKKSSGSCIAATKKNYQLTNEHHRHIIRTFKRVKVYSSFRDKLEVLI